MATRSMIGRANDDGSILAVYCHWDGYIDHNGAILVESYDADKLEELLALGDLSSLDDDIETCEFYSRDRNDHIDQTRALVIDGIDGLAQAADDCGAEYVYIMLPTGVWMVYDTFAQTTGLVSDLLNKEQVND